MAAMKAMKAMKKKPISAKLAKRHAFFGKIDKTATGLKETDLVKSKSGKIVSKKKSLLGKQSPWIAAVQKARKELKILPDLDLTRSVFFNPVAVLSILPKNA